MPISHYDIHAPFNFGPRPKLTSTNIINTEQRGADTEIPKINSDGLVAAFIHYRVISIMSSTIDSTTTGSTTIGAEQSLEASDNPMFAIKQLDYTVIFARDMAAMRHFYQRIMQFPIQRTLGEQWIEFRVGSNTLALTQKGVIFKDEPTPQGALSLQLAFRVPPAMVDRCIEHLQTQGVKIELPPTDQSWGHRTAFFRDPDGNVLEIYADI